METALLTAAISGLFSLATALASVWLKHYLEQHHTVPAAGAQPAAAEQRTRVQGARGLSFSRPLVILVSGFVIGVLSRALRSAIRGPVHYEALLSILLLAAICLALALDHRRARRGFWPYQLEVFALWAAFTSGWSVVHGHVWSDLLSMTIMLWLACAVVGGIVVSLTRRGARGS